MEFHYQPAKFVQPGSEDVQKLPTNRPVAIYYRQSTEAQVGNVSTSMQTIDMIQYLQQLGWHESQILLIDMDAGISGTTKIRERPGMSSLFDLITEARIGAVACQDEDRLFRDITMIQVNIFIEACRVSRVWVITPSMTYDFANELTGAFHARQFRFKSEMAAEYLNSVILGRIQQAKCRMLAEGRWVGGGIPIGFMVDRRKVLADGNRNPEYSRYVPFEPYMGIVHQYFQICIACDYRIRPMTHEIIRNGPYLPDPNVWKPPPGYITRYMLSNPIEGKGYALCVATLRYLLTDVAYIGHWVLRGSIVRWNNHPAIVPTDLFMDVFNHLSHTTLEGGQNLEVQENSVRRRSDPKEAQSADLPLLAGKIYSYHQDKWLLANTHYRASDHYYIYSVWAPFPDEEVLWVKSAKVIDQRIIHLFLDKLSAAREQGNWDRMIKTFRAFVRHEELQEKTKRIQSLSRGIRNLIESLETLSNREMIKDAQTRYEKLQAEWERLTEEVRDLQKQDELFQKAIERLNDPEQGMVSAWAQLSTEQKQTILGLGVKRIEVEKIEENALHLTIHWADHGSEDFSMPRMAGQWNSWLPSDRRRLLDLVERKSTKQEILAAFPDIRWKSIMHEIYYLHGRVCIENNIQLRGGETYRKYLLRTQEERGRENEKRS